MYSLNHPVLLMKSITTKIVLFVQPPRQRQETLDDSCVAFPIQNLAFAYKVQYGFFFFYLLTASTIVVSYFQSTGMSAN